MGTQCGEEDLVGTLIVWKEPRHCFQTNWQSVRCLFSLHWSVTYSGSIFMARLHSELTTNF